MRKENRLIVEGLNLLKKNGRAPPHYTAGSFTAFQRLICDCPESHSLAEVKVLSPLQLCVCEPHSRASEPLLLSEAPPCDVVTMTKCVKTLHRHLATSITKSSKWSGLIGRAGAKSEQVALSQTKCLSGLAHYVIPALWRSKCHAEVWRGKCSR